MLTRLQYRKQVGLGGKRQPIAKYAVFKNELVSADTVKDKNDNFGFSCLHYSVSEASGQIKIAIINKNKTIGRVRACTIDQEAKAGEDFDKVDTIVEFGPG
jgi:hypothetical protein